MAQEPQEKSENRSSTSSRPQGQSRYSSGGRQQGNRRSYGGGGGGGRRGRFQPRRKVCAFCADKEKKINWKQPETVRRYVGDAGQIFPRRKSGLCAKHQRRVTVAIKRARYMSLLPYTSEHIRIMRKG